MITTRTYSRAVPRKDWTWLYVVSFIIVAAFAYDVERHMEMNQLPLPIDYN